MQWEATTAQFLSGLEMSRTQCPPLLADFTQHLQVDAATTRATAGVQMRAGESVALLLNRSPEKSSSAPQVFLDFT